MQYRRLFFTDVSCVAIGAEGANHIQQVAWAHVQRAEAEGVLIFRLSFTWPHVQTVSHSFSDIDSTHFIG